MSKYACANCGNETSECECLKLGDPDSLEGTYVKEIQRLQSELAEANAKIMRLECDGVLSDCESQYQMLSVKNKQLTVRVAVLEEALTQILGWRELRDTPYVPIDRIEEIAKKALEDSV